MVELDPKDYSEILNWLTLAYGKDPALGEGTLRTFWKLTFLAEDKMDEKLALQKPHSNCATYLVTH